MTFPSRGFVMSQKFCIFVVYNKLNVSEYFGKIAKNQSPKKYRNLRAQKRECIVKNRITIHSHLSIMWVKIKAFMEKM